MNNCHSSGRVLLLYAQVFVKVDTKLNDVIIDGYHSNKLHKTLLSRLAPNVGEIIGRYQCRFHLNRSSADQILCFRQILEKK